MRIGVDIDGVLNDFEKFMDEISDKYNLAVVDTSGNNFDLRFGMSKENAELIWDKERAYYLTNYPPRKNCNEIINHLIKENEIILVSNRGYGINPDITVEYVYDLTKKWLEANQINYTKLFFIEGSKKPLIISEKLDVFIDDSANVINDLKDVVPVICFSASYNKHLTNEIVRANSWSEIKEILNNFEKEKSALKNI